MEITFRVRQFRRWQNVPIMFAENTTKNEDRENCKWYNWLVLWPGIEWPRQLVNDYNTAELGVLSVRDPGEVLHVSLVSVKPRTPTPRHEGVVTENEKRDCVDKQCTPSRRRLWGSNVTTKERLSGERPAELHHFPYSPTPPLNPHTQWLKDPTWWWLRLSREGCCRQSATISIITPTPKYIVT